MNLTRSSSERGWSQAWKRLGAALMQGLELRLDLWNLEFQEEKKRFFVALFLTLLTAFLAFLSFLCLNVLIVLLLWDTHRTAAVLGMTLGYLALALGCAFWLRHRLSHGPDPFSASLEEMRKDYAALGGDDE